ncbi:MAG: asparaginase domain-containing protein [Kiritimatiellia bacterium]
MSGLLIYTGGTLGGKRRGRGPVFADYKPAAFARLLEKSLPEAGDWVVESALGKLSENVAPADWAVLARTIDAGVRRGVRAIVVAHGTDTMIYTACALRWLLKGVPVPVVLTGSALPLGDSGTDAIRNLGHAMALARSARKRPGVWLAFAGMPGGSLVLDPVNARKDAARPDFFQPVWGCAAGAIRGDAGKVSWRIPLPVQAPEYEPHFNVDSRAALFTLHPGFEPETFRRAWRAGARGIVLAGYGSGTGCAEGAYDLRPAVREAVDRGVPVWLVSQHGDRVRIAYGSTAGLKRAGATLLEGWTPEAALTAMMCGGRQREPGTGVTHLVLSEAFPRPGSRSTPAIR